jgi:CDP-diacylglycerol--serine O-phosphatidyltransferase
LKGRGLFLGIYNRSVILTYVGIGVAVCGLGLAGRGEVRYALVCLVLAGICDLFDGYVARLTERDDEAKAFGVQIDSLADIVDFGALPAVIAMALAEWQLYVWPFATVYVIAACIRLGFFNILTAQAPADEPRRSFRGLPVTYASLIFPTFYLLIQLCLPSLLSLLPLLMSLLLLAVAFAFLRDVRVPKPQGVFYLIFPLLALALIVGLLLL